MRNRSEHCFRQAVRLLFCILCLGMALAHCGPVAAAEVAVSGCPIPLTAPDTQALTITWLRQLPVRAARVRGVPCIAAADGLDATAQPLSAPLEIELSRSFPLSYAELDGSGEIRLQAGNQEPSAVTAPAFLSLPPNTRERRLLLTGAAPHAQLREARFYSYREAALPPTDIPLLPSGDSPLTLRSAPLATGQGLSAVLLDLRLKPPYPAGVRVRLTQSSEPDRSWFDAALRLLASPQASTVQLQLVLEPPQSWGDPGEQITLTLTPLAGTLQPAQLTAGVATDRAEAVREDYVRARLNWLSAWYAANAAAAPWEQPDWNPAKEPAIRWLRTLQAWQPQHPGVLAYAARLLHQQQAINVPVSGPANAPGWACLAHEILKRTQYLAYWWRNTRRQPDGLFGDAPDADALLLDEFAGLPLITGDPLLRDALRQGAETIWLSRPDAQDDVALRRWQRGIACVEPARLLAAPGDLAPVEHCLQLAAADSANPLAVDSALAAAWYSGNPDLPRRLAETNTGENTPERLRLLLDLALLRGTAKLPDPVTRAVAAGTADPLLTCLWRTGGDPAWDERLLQEAQAADDLRAYAGWQAGGDKLLLTDGLRRALNNLVADQYLLTEAHLPPEVLAIPGQLLLRFLYLGGPAGWRGGIPRAAVTWEDTGADYAAFVTENQADRLKVLAYSFQPQERPVQMRVWGLRPGAYTLTTGVDTNNDDVPDQALARRGVTVERGTPLSLVLPAQQSFVILLHARRLAPERLLPDMALTAEDVAVSPDRRRATVRLHNIGAAPATGIRLQIQDEHREILGTARLASLPYPKEGTPVVQAVTVSLRRPAPERFRVAVTTAGAEITLHNNTAAITAR